MCASKLARLAAQLDWAFGSPSAPPPPPTVPRRRTLTSYPWSHPVKKVRFEDKISVRYFGKDEEGKEGDGGDLEGGVEREE